MARRSQSSAFAYDEEFGPRKAWRLGIWATVAMTAVIAAVVAGFVDSGARHARATAPPRPPAPATPTAGSPGFDAEMEARRLAEAVRLLAADRDRLMARINTLERNLGDVTGSIPSAGAAVARPAERPNPSTAGIPPMLAPAPPASPAASPTAAGPPPAASRPGPPQGAAGMGQTAEPAASGDRPASLAAIVDSGPSGSIATKTDFGVDLGSAANVEGLRALWHSVRGANATLFDGLRPVVAVRDGSKSGTFELRLVVGPLANAGAAARLCATLAAALTCQPTIFDGQRLALK